MEHCASVNMPISINLKLGRDQEQFIRKSRLSCFGSGVLCISSVSRAHSAPSASAHRSRTGSFYPWIPNSPRGLPDRLLHLATSETSALSPPSRPWPASATSTGGSSWNLNVFPALSDWLQQRMEARCCQAEKHCRATRLSLRRLAAWASTRPPTPRPFLPQPQLKRLLAQFQVDLDFTAL